MIDFDREELKIITACLINGLSNMEMKLETPWNEDDIPRLTRHIALAERALGKAAEALRGMKDA